MITSFEVGTIFKIVDKATPTVRALTRDVTRLEEISLSAKKALQSLGTLSLGTIRKNMGLLTDQGVRLQGVYGSAFKSIEAGTDASINRTKLLAAEWSKVAAAAKQAGASIAFANRAPRGAGPVIGGGGSRNPSAGRSALGMYAGRSAQLGGTHFGVHGRGMGGNAALAGAGMLAYSVYQEAQIEDIAARAIMTGQIKVDSNMRSSDAFKRIRSVIQQNSAKTGFSPKEVGEAILTTERQFGGLSFDKRIDLENRVLPYAAIEARLKESSLPETFKAMAGLPHMFGVYNPKGQEELMRQFSFASLMTPVPIPQFERALSYSGPILHQGMGMDPSTTMFLTAMTESAGITSTKSGTWIRSFFEKLMPQTGINAMHNAPMHNAMLGQLGLLDDKGQPSWKVKGADGKVDWNDSIVNVATILSDALAKIPDDKRMGFLTGVFGERGGGFGALLNAPEFVAQFPVLLQKMKEWKGGDQGIMEYLQGSPVQQGRQAWADTQNVMMDIGSTVLPTLLVALRRFDQVLKEISGPIAWVNNKVLGNDSKAGDGGSGFLGAVRDGMLTGGVLGGAVSIGSGPGIIAGIGGGAVAGGFYSGGQFLARKYLPGGAVDGGFAPSSNIVPADKLFHKMSYNQETDSLDKNRFALNQLTDAIRKASLTGNGGAQIIPASFTTSGDSILGSSGSWSDIGQGAIGGASSGGASSGGGIARSIRRGSGGGMTFPSGPPPSGRAGRVTQSQTAGAKRLMTGLMARGWSKEAAAVAAGNASVESGFNPGNSSGDHGTSWGLMQWHLDRRSRMVGEAAKKGVPWQDWDHQVGFLDKEWRERFGNDSVKSKDLSKLKYMGKRYEGYSTSSFGARNALTDKFLGLQTEDAKQAPAIIPPPIHKEKMQPITLLLDGRVVAKSTMKHMVAMGNGPARGPRLADYTATRPINV